MKSRGTFACALVGFAVAAAGCGGPDPTGPDVTGWTLPQAQHALHKVGVHTQVHTDALFGVLIPANFTVCKEVSLNANTVRLEVEKYGC